MKRIFLMAIVMALLFGLAPIGSLPVAAASMDLVVKEFTWNAGTEITPGTSVVFTATIENEGNLEVNAPFTVTFGTADTVFTTITYTKPIAPRATITLESQPWSSVKGDYMVSVCVDVEKAITESDEANNSSQANLRVAEDKLSSAYSVTQKLLEEYDLKSLIFSEDFNDLSSVDTTNTGKPGYKWYVARAYGASVLTTDDYSVENGIMTLHVNKPTYNYGLDTYNCKTGVGFAYNKGYMEVRLRIPRARKNTEEEKGVPAIWALSVDKLNNTADAWVEMDWMEYWGINGYDSNTPNGFYTVTLHDQHLTGTVVTTHFKNSNYKCEGLGDGQWHTMGWLWQDNLFIAYLDGVEVMRQVYSPTTDATPSPYTQKSDGTVDKIGVFSLLNTQYNPIIIGGSKDNPMELDYVRVWNNSHTASKDTTNPPEAEPTTPTTPPAQETPTETTPAATEGTTPETTEGTAPAATEGAAPTTAPTTAPTEQAQTPADSDDKTAIGVYVAVAAVVVVLGCAAALLVWRKKKKKSF